MGVWGIVPGEIKRYGKKKIATVCLSAGPVVTLVTNSSKVIGAATRVHSLVSFAAECVEDSGKPIDFALFCR